MIILNRRIARAAFAMLVSLLVGGIGWAILTLPTEWHGLNDHITAKLAESGVRNPVTAVLLNFRAYDTLLEIGVLLVAALVVRGLASEDYHIKRARFNPPGPVLMGLLRLVGPLIVVVAGYLLWVGSHAPGGAFQAGALLAAVVVLMLLCDWQMPTQVPDWLERMLLSGGLFVFIAVGLVSVALNGSLLQYPTKQAKWLVLLIEAACAVSIAMVLAALFAGGKVSSSDHVALSEQKEKGP